MYNKFPEASMLLTRDHTGRTGVLVLCGRNFKQEPRALGIGISVLLPNSQDSVSPSVDGDNICIPYLIGLLKLRYILKKSFWFFSHLLQSGESRCVDISFL